MKSPIWLFSFVLVSFACAADLQERVAAFRERFPAPAAVEARYQEWRKAEPNNPDAYILPANALLCAADRVNFVAGDITGSAAAIVDPKTNQQVGSIVEDKDLTLVKKAGDMLAAASERFPHRLDIHVGRLVVAKQMEDIAGAKDVMLKLLSLVSEDPKALRWIDGAALQEVPLTAILREVKPRIRWLYSLEKPEADQAAYDCVLESLKLDAKSVELLNHAALYHCYRGEWKHARPFLLQAEKLAPKDWIIQHNLARASLELGDKADALKRLQTIVREASEKADVDAAEENIRKYKLAPVQE
jgi:tetratricopeptide (TPR) repeat protein